MKKFLQLIRPFREMRKIAALCLVMVMAMGAAWAQTATYEQLTSIANIDESAQYVLGVDGTGFHYTGTSTWGKTALPSAQTPIYYTLTKSEDGESFTAQATIEGTTYYLQIPTSNTFSMATEEGTNTDIVIGTTQISETNYAIANKNTTARHLRINGTNGLRSYAGTTGTMAFFYKVVPASGTTYTVTYYSNISETDPSETDPIEEIYTEGETVTVADNTFVNSGYAFTEWNTLADGTGDSYSPGDEIENIDADIDLYAQWEVSNEMTLTFALNSNPGEWPTTQSATLTEYTYPLGGVDYTFALQNVKCNNGYLMIYYVGAVGLPAIEGYKLTKVVASNSSGCSTSTQVGVSTSASQANYIAGGAAQTWSTQGSQYTYNLTSTDANTVYYLYVTNKNAQVTSLALTYEAVDADAPSITASNVDIAYDATSGSIAYTIENEPSPAGELTASTTANWLTLGTVTSEAVPFTCTENDDVVSRTATVTLTYAYDNSTLTRDITVTQGVDETLGTADNPYTVAQARAFIDGLNGSTSTEKYVAGIISQIDGYNANYSSITYWISDDGTTTDQMEVYSGKGINGAAFSSVDDVELTAEVVVKGNLKKYNTTYEFDRNNELVVYNGPQHDVEAPTFDPEAGTYADAQTVTITCETADASIYYTLDGTEPTDESTLYTEALTISTTTTVKAIAYVGTEASNVATATYHICSAENPYTVTDALAFNEYPANGIYVSGIVSTAPTAAPTNSGQLTYFISVDGEAQNQLEIYKGLGLNEAAFTAQDDIQVGDIVTVYGNVVIYGTTNPIKEFAQGNYLVSFSRPTPVLEEYDLTVSALNEHINAIYVFAANNQNDLLIEDGLAGTVQVLEGTDIIVSPDVEEGYVLTSLTVLDDEGTSVQPANHMSDGGYYSFTMPSGPVTITATAALAEDYELYSDALVEGDYIIYYNGYALKNEQLGTTGRLSYETVSPVEDVIATADATIVWHIAPSATEGYWTIYSDDAQAYAAGTGAKNKAQMLEDGTDDKALWSVTTEEGTYEFTNKNNYEADPQVNYLLRNNGTNGFACYAAATGGALSLYKKVEEIIDEPCGTILVDANNPVVVVDDFEGYNITTTDRWTGVEPTCWTLVAQYTGDNDTLPQVYRGFNTTENGQYSLRMHFNYLYAMPELDTAVNLANVRLSLNVRQPYWRYKLQIGVMDNLDNPESFVPVAVVNNSGKNMTHFECGFENYTGTGRYIAFKNIGNSENDPYCTNYLDDVTLTYVNPDACHITLGETEDFEDYTAGGEPICWEVITEDVTLSSTTRPQVYAGFNSTAGGSNSLVMRNRCVYAMPELGENVNINDLTMTFNLRQPKSIYRLQVGVVDEQGNFTLVKTLKSGTAMEEKTVSFANCQVSGRIAFRNTLVPGAGLATDYLDYSYNYIDDINIDYTAAKIADGSAIDAEDMDAYLEDIAVYPNPTTGYLYIDAVDVQKVECYNQMGQLVRVYDNANEISISEFTDGVYMLRITVPQGVTMRKVVKR